MGNNLKSACDGILQKAATGKDRVPGVVAMVTDRSANVYEGARDAHPGPAQPSPHPEPAPSGPGADQGGIILTPAEVSAVFAAADIAADDKRYRIEMCPDCSDQSCPACQTHLRDAEAFDRITDRMLQAARTAPAANHDRARTPRRQSGPAADKEDQSGDECCQAEQEQSDTQHGIRLPARAPAPRQCHRRRSRSWSGRSPRNRSAS